MPPPPFFTPNLANQSDSTASLSWSFQPVRSVTPSVTGPLGPDQPADPFASGIILEYLILQLP